MLIVQLPRCHVIKKEPHPFTFLKTVGSLSKLKKKTCINIEATFFNLKGLN
jgi:beta-phosphoglucomutase-like phosphatase (HAD superfamily)